MRSKLFILAFFVTLTACHGKDKATVFNFGDYDNWMPKNGEVVATQPATQQPTLPTAQTPPTTVATPPPCQLPTAPARAGSGLVQNSQLAQQVLVVGPPPTQAPLVRPKDDINGDCIPDFVVGAPGYDNYTGLIEIHDGYKTATSQQTHTIAKIFGISLGDKFGSTAAIISDLDGDGSPEVMVGAPNAKNTAGASVGKVYIYNKPTIDRASAGQFHAEQDAWKVFEGSAADDKFGVSFAIIGDVNRDGFQDIAIASVRPIVIINNQPQTPTISNYVSIYSSRDFTLISKITGDGFGDGFGRTIVKFGDINGDRLDDFAISASGTAATKGKVHIFLGSATMSATQTASSASSTIEGVANSDVFGQSLAVGNVVGDSKAELLIGAPGANSFTGSVYIFDMATLPANANGAIHTINGENPNDLFGSKISISDTHGANGNSMLLVGAFGYNSRAGRAYLYGSQEITAPANPPTTPIDRPQALTNMYFGLSVAWLNMTLDNYALPIIIGSANSITIIKASIMSIMLSSVTSTSISINGSQQNDNFGYVVGDYNSSQSIFN